MMKYIFVLVSIFAGSSTFAQDGTLKAISAKGSILKVVEMVVKRNTLYTSLDPDFLHTSLVLQLGQINQNMKGSYLFFGESDKRYFKTGEHSPNDESIISSELVIARKPSTTFSFFSGNLEGKVIFKLIYAKPLKNSGKPDKKKTLIPCDFPTVIDQDLWRAGLPVPTITPTSHVVNHVILHHSAGSNTDTDYLNTVRNVYLFHTQVNNYDDMGYNYLVAPNGDIYAGRDGFGSEDDNIKGAHFCNKNNNTMGICLLGNYQTAIPTDTALQSISQLIAWKLKKENINPLDSTLHPENLPSQFLLGTIAGHRNGCATECPGDNYFAKIDSLKNVVASKLTTCNSTALPPFTHLHNAISVYPNPTSNSIIINSVQTIIQYQIINLFGNTLYTNFPNTNNTTFNFQNIAAVPGVYMIRINTISGWRSYKSILTP